MLFFSISELDLFIHSKKNFCFWFYAFFGSDFINVNKTYIYSGGGINVVTLSAYDGKRWQMTAF